ncbi:hypothetical protein D6817_02965 [Candidatus Pacearchaeota archaeon]|nr:MAG: hypothetical protein D6817_02965 [Candidatus Pacearchaeota archaeon]
MMRNKPPASNKNEKYWKDAREVKLLVIGDLHGRKPRIHFKNFDAIICVGDVASDKEFKTYVALWKKHLKNKDWISFDDFLNEKFGKRKLRELENRSIEVGNKVLRFLDKFNKPVFFVPGNWDQSGGETRIKEENINKSHYNYFKSFLDYYLGDELNAKLTKGVKNLRDCQFKLHTFGNLNFIGYGLSSAPEKPLLNKKRFKFSDEELRKLERVYQKILGKLEKAYSKRNKNFATIFISHNVPYKTKLDVIKDKESDTYGKHYGSTIAREFIVKRKPLLCASGHMHEHFGKDKIGKTLVLNAGFGPDKNILVKIDTAKKKIKNMRFHHA